MIPTRIPTSPWAIEPGKAEEYLSIVSTVDWATYEAAPGNPRNPSGQDTKPYPLLPGGVAQIDIRGPVVKADSSLMRMFGMTSTMRARSTLNAAVRDPDVKSIVLVIDSPGGEVDGTGDLADAVARCPKPTVAYCEDLCCSAGYWIASQADEVYCNASASVGCIGTYMVVRDVSAARAAQGIRTYVISSGGVKGAGVPGSEIRPEQLAAWQSEIDDITDLFVMSVARGRGLTPEAAKELATGHTWIGQKAVAAGLVDQVMAFDDLVTRMGGTGRVSGADGGTRPMGLKEKMLAVLIGAAADDVETPGSEDPSVEAASNSELEKVRAERDSLSAKLLEQVEATNKAQIESSVAKFVADLGGKLSPDLEAKASAAFRAGLSVDMAGNVVESEVASAVRALAEAVPDLNLDKEVVTEVPIDPASETTNSGYGTATKTGREAKKRAGGND